MKERENWKFNYYFHFKLQDIIFFFFFVKDEFINQI